MNKAIPTERANMINVPEWDQFLKDDVLHTLVEELLKLGTQAKLCHDNGDSFDVRTFTSKISQNVWDLSTFAKQERKVIQ